MPSETRFEKCPVCQSQLKCTGKYSTMYVYVCQNPKCKRKWNQDALASREYEKATQKKKK